MILGNRGIWLYKDLDCFFKGETRQARLGDVLRAPPLPGTLTGSGVRAFVSCPSGNLVAFPEKTEKVRIENLCPSQLSNYMFISTLVGSTGEGHWKRS